MRNDMNILNHRLVDQTFQASPNHGDAIAPLFIVMHFTGSFFAPDAIEHLCDPDAENPVSAHVVLDRDGAIAQLVPFNMKAWHAGNSSFSVDGQTYVGLNACSIGIEIVNPGWFVIGPEGELLHSGIKQVSDEEIRSVSGLVQHALPDGRLAYWAVYPETQIEALERLTRSLVVEYPGIRHVVGHEMIAPGRKVDPGPAFPMSRFERLVARSGGLPR